MFFFFFPVGQEKVLAICRNGEMKKNKQTNKQTNEQKTNKQKNKMKPILFLRQKMKYFALMARCTWTLLGKEDLEDNCHQLQL